MKMEVEKECYISNYPIPMKYNQLKTMIYQIENCICMIKIDSNEGTGFF